MNYRNAEFLNTNKLNLDDNARLRWAVAVFPIFFIAVSLWVKVFTPNLYLLSILEDGFIEWSTALAFGAAGAVAFLMATRLRQTRRLLLSWLYVGLGAGMFLAMLEEISWGQRVLSVDSPEFFAENSVKDEINLHNLQQFPLQLAFMTIGFYGAFSRFLAPPALRRRFPTEVDLLTPRYSIAGYFLPTFLLYVYFEYVYREVMIPLGITVRRSYDWSAHFIDAKEQEPLELLLALGFLVFVLDNWQRYGRTSRQVDALAV